MQPTNTANDRPQGEDKNLDRRYGKIGIPAVAAALRYQSEAKNPADATVVSRWHDEMAA